MRIEDGRSSLFYSGDGRPTPETLDLARGCDLAVHEAFRLDGETPGHGTVLDCIRFAREASVRMLALVHVQRNERRDRREEIAKAVGEVKDLRVFLPEPGDEFEL